MIFRERSAGRHGEAEAERGGKHRCGHTWKECLVGRA